MPTSIYFSGSISGGREDADMYRTIVSVLEAEGHRVFAGSVTAMHVGADGEPLDAHTIFTRDTEWLEEVARARGVLVAEISRPSIGVGYEIAMARHRFQMPVICLYRPAFTRRCSGMVAGDRDIRVIEYTDETAAQMLEKLRLALRE